MTKQAGWLLVTLCVILSLPSVIPSGAGRSTAAAVLPLSHVPQIEYFPDPETAFHHALSAYTLQVAPHRLFDLSDAHTHQGWAYAVAYGLDAFQRRIPYVFIVLLAQEDSSLGWHAIAPEVSTAQEYNAWLGAFPVSLLDEATKAYLRRPEPGHQTMAQLNFGGHRLPWEAGQIGYVTNKDGYQHENQVDFDILGSGASGDVHASKPGTVVFVKESSATGCCDFSCWQQANMVVIQHGDSEYSWYVHLAYGSVPVSVGDTVGFATKIGVEGETGYACGVHLHYMGSTGHTSWTNPDDPGLAPWATGTTAVDFDEVSWADLAVGQGYTSENTRSSGTTTRISVASDGTQGNGASQVSSISADGRYVAFRSYASNLVSGDTNGADDVFVHDLHTGQTRRVSVASDGIQGNDMSQEPSISGDGRDVAFHSYASNLVSGDTNGCWDVFVHDQRTEQTTRISVASDGTQANADSDWPSISAGGRYVAFGSFAGNLVPGDTNGYPDIFVHDRQTGQTSRVSVASDAAQGNGDSLWPSISADGRYVAFGSVASSLVPGDTSGYPDVFVHDRQTGQTSRVSVASDGTEGNSGSYWPSISADGRYVVFHSYASNLVSGDTNGYPDIFVHDRHTGQTSRVSVASDGAQGNNVSQVSSISADGHYVAFGSVASNLVTGDTNGYWDIFAHDRRTGQTTRISVASNRAQGNAGSDWPSVSADGRYAVFHSYASNLVSGDTNGVDDVFVHDRRQGQATTVAAVSPSGAHLTSWTYNTDLIFPAGTFTETAVVTFTTYYPGTHPLPSDLASIGRFLEITAAYSMTGQMAQPSQPYTITARYTDAERGPAIEDTLGLYWWDGDSWSSAGISSSVDITGNTVTAQVDHLSHFSVLGETRRVHLPLTLRSY